MPKVVDYIILGDSSRETLRRDVKEKLKDGWELYGPPYVTSSDGPRQAMVLYGPEVDKVGEEL